MGVTDRDYMKKEEEEPKQQDWLRRLNEFGERHAKLIIFLSTAIVIIAVLIVADSMWKKSRFQHGIQDLDAAVSVEQLVEIREKYGNVEALLPRILFRLGNAYQTEAAATREGPEKARELLKKAEETYNEFREKFGQPGHRDPLSEEVDKALRTVFQNMEFLETDQSSLLKTSTLITHPLTEVKVEDSPIRFGPFREPNPVVVFELSANRRIEIELFEDETPNTVANFIELCEAKYFEGLKFAKKGEKRLEIEKKEDAPSRYWIPFERSARESVAGILAMQRQDGGPHNRGAEFLVLLLDDEELKDHTIFGEVRGHTLPLLRSLEEGDKIEAVRVERKREHEYKPEKIGP